MRSFTEDNLGPRVLTVDGGGNLRPTDSPAGGEFYSLMNVELRAPLYGPTEFAIFADAGLEPEPIAVWGIPLDFDEWVERMATPAPRRAQLRALFEDATDRVRAAFALRTQGGYGFEIPIALLRGRRPG